MQTRLPVIFSNTLKGQEADAIIRKCVHCGLCNATCPTYQLLGNELDGPRGRIYLIKQALENDFASERTRIHLDRCLTCRACETTCPSGVRYERLLTIGREAVDRITRRPLYERGLRWLLCTLLPYPKRVAPWLGLGRFLRPILAPRLANKIPEYRASKPPPARLHSRRMLTLAGCVQSLTAPHINAAAARVLDHVGISLISEPSINCCGAIQHHLGAAEEGLAQMRRNIDAWWPHIEAGVEFITITSSACAAMVKEYGQLLANDPEYATKAKRISSLARDLSEAVCNLELNLSGTASHTVAFHSPCTLQHGQQIHGVVEDILQQAGYTLTAVSDPHLCCGSAGTYSLLQPALSRRLLINKLTALQAAEPTVIATANIGCMLHFATAAKIPVRHWIELLDERLPEPK